MNSNSADWKRLVQLVVLAATLSLGMENFAPAAAPAAKPNILILLADDKYE
jgi:hypothetical protein